LKERVALGNRPTSNANEAIRDFTDGEVRNVNYKALITERREPLAIRERES
jgi:hypothetical protein